MQNDRKFASRLERIALRLAFKDIPISYGVVSRGWRSLSEEDLMDMELVEEEFRTLLDFHARAAKMQTEYNKDLMARERIDDMKREIAFWKKKKKPFQKKKDVVSESKVKVYNMKIKDIEQVIEGLKSKVVTDDRLSKEDTDRALDVLNESIIDFIIKLEDNGWEYPNIERVINKAVIGSGYGYDQDIGTWKTKWLRKKK